MYKALYREYRPETFEEVLGQDHIVRILKNQLHNDAVSHAYLFCGTRGTGKTTMARLLAKGVNCLSPREDGGPCGECENCKAIKAGTFMDVIEIDAASNNGVDNIRELRESVKYPPAAGKKKVYIIDEVHMLSSGAFNALLKTLEEPPEYVMFILATTEPQKLLATILSRCMRLDFKRVPEQVLCEGMKIICADKGIDVEEGAIRLIAANADGSVRDGLSILDQCLAGGEKHITRDDVLDLLGATGEEVFLEITDLAKRGKTSDALMLIDKVLADGRDVRQFIRDWLGHYRNLMIVKYLKAPEDVLGISIENAARLKEQSDRLEMAEINNAIIELSHTMADAKWSTQPRVLLELCAVKLATGNAFARTVAMPQTVVQSAAPVAAETQAPTTQAVAAAAPKTQAAPADKNSVAEAAPKAAAPAASEDKPPVAAAPEDNPPVAAAPAPATTGAPAAQEQQPSPAEEFDFDMEELWARVFEEAETREDTSGTFNLLPTKTYLHSIKGNEAFVVADNKFTGKYVNENIGTIEAVLQQLTGAPLKVVTIVKAAEKGEEKKADPEAVKEGLESLLGISVDLK